MPYRISKQGSKWVLVNKRTGKVKSHHATRQKAEAAERAILASEHGFVGLLRNKS